MKLKKILFGVAFSIIIIGSGKIKTTATEMENEELYPITVESDDWFDYSVEEKSEMLKLDSETTKEMTDEQLVRAIADYPYLIDIYICDTLNEGLEKFKDNCDAYKELMERKNGVDSFVKYSKQLIFEMEKEPREDGRTEFVTLALKDIAEQLKANAKVEVLNITSRISGPVTPKGSGVPYYVIAENHTSSYHAARDKETVNSYGVTLVRNGSCKYNCHSYAWYSTSSSNSYWIDNPSIYMTDGSYKRIYNGGVSASITSYGFKTNDKIYYAKNTHSAIFVDNPTNGALLATLRVRSKWGQLGVFEHTITKVPKDYDYSTVSAWHKK